LAFLVVPNCQFKNSSKDFIMILLSRVRTSPHFIRAARASTLRELKACRSDSSFAAMLGWLYSHKHMLACCTPDLFVDFQPEPPPRFSNNAVFNQVSTQYWHVGFKAAAAYCKSLEQTLSTKYCPQVIKAEILDCFNHADQPEQLISSNWQKAAMEAIKHRLGGDVFRAIDPKLPVMFDIHNLVSRRSVVFARAGYGKSNLMKFLIAELYRNQPKTESGANVGALIFDADGEYFWPDRVRNRPGLCDVPQLRDKLVLFTNRPAPSPYYGDWKAGEIKLDIRDLPARDVISIAVSSERQTQQNVLKLKAVSPTNWRQLIDLIHTQGLQASDNDVGRLLGYQGQQIQNAVAEIAAARSNITTVVRTLHDPNSRVLSGTISALQSGCVVVLDISLLSSGAGNMIAGLVLRRLFAHNQENFTGGRPIIPTIAIIEEAQSVLGRNLDETSPFVEWVKEGRKYDLGAILITQQPGSMAPVLLSQSDNWFSFHLLSEGDARTLGKYNSHYSNDVLSHLVGEPISGNCFMWSAPHQPFVLPVRVRNFEKLYDQNVKSDPNEPARRDTQANEIVRTVGEAQSRLADKLKAQLLDPKVKYVRVPNAMPDGSEGIGVSSGQLYYLIKEIKEASDTTPEDALKELLLNMLLGEGAVHQVRLETAGKDYFCASEEAWVKVLGKKPDIKNART
jgi:hypothetical protein